MKIDQAAWNPDRDHEFNRALSDAANARFPGDQHNYQVQAANVLHNFARQAKVARPCDCTTRVMKKSDGTLLTTEEKIQFHRDALRLTLKPSSRPNLHHPQAEYYPRPTLTVAELCADHQFSATHFSKDRPYRKFG